MALIEKKTIYRPRFKGYYLLCGLVQIIDGITCILTSPFGYTSMIYSDFCMWNMKRDMQRRKNAKRS